MFPRPARAATTYQSPMDDEDTNPTIPPTAGPVVCVRMVDHCNSFRIADHFHGPLSSSTPKSKVIESCERAASVSEEASSLLWRLCSLLVKHSGVIGGADGLRDVAGMLCPSEDEGCPKDAALLPSSRTLEDQQEAARRVQSLLVQGRKDEAVDLAVRESLWEVALLLSSSVPAKHAEVVKKTGTVSLHTFVPAVHTGPRHCWRGWRTV
eukprot:Rmarinus@m.23687